MTKNIMTRKEKIAALDASVADLFRKGGPQRPVSAGTYKEQSKVTALLEAEQQRLLRTWNEGSDE